MTRYEPLSAVPGSNPLAADDNPNVVRQAETTSVTDMAVMQSRVRHRR